MDNLLIQKLLHAQITAKGQVEISVSGISMQPALFNSDKITVVKCIDYSVGDILVFSYKSGELLVHRLLKKDDEYFCKGDNSFRLENITIDQIIGKVISVNSFGIVPCPQRLILLSYLVNRAFFRCRYNIEVTKQSDIYRLYEKVILRKEDIPVIYKKNENMDYIQSDETALAVFDPESGDTHFFDETGIDILYLLSEPRDLDSLLLKLSEIYSVVPIDIREDVMEFLDDVVSKNIVETL